MSPNQLNAYSKKGMSAHQFHRSIGVTYKTAWFMFHRVRHAMADPDFQRAMLGVVEVDETYIGGVDRSARIMTVWGARSVRRAAYDLGSRTVRGQATSLSISSSDGMTTG
jgi:hypothetical protein